MKKTKSTVVGICLMCLLLFLFACGKQTKVQQKEDKTTEKQTTQASTEENATSEEMAEENVMPDVEGDTIYIYSYDDQFAQVLEYFYKKYPEYKERVKLISADMGPNSDRYQSYIRKALEIKRPKKKDEEENVELEDDLYPSLIVNSSMMASSFVQNNYSASLSNIGIRDEDLAQMYPYTIKKASFLGDAKALTWYTTPGVFLYRTDIAEEVLGDSDVKTVQGEMTDWNSFRKLAQKMKDAGYKMLSGPDELTYAMMQQKDALWIQRDKLHVDGSASICIGMSRDFLNEEFTSETAITDPERAESFDGDVFGWFVYPEEITAGMKTEIHTGQFQICEGPGAFQWGSDYISVSPDCRDKDLAALVVRTICLDEDVLREMAKNNVIVNNPSIVSEMAKQDKKNPKINEQKAMETYAKVLSDIKGDTMSCYDELFESWIQELSYQYNRKEIDSVESVIENFKDHVTNQYNYIFVD